MVSVPIGNRCVHVYEEFKTEMREEQQKQTYNSSPFRDTDLRTLTDVPNVLLIVISVCRIEGPMLYFSCLCQPKPVSHQQYTLCY